MSGFIRAPDRPDVHGETLEQDATFVQKFKVSFVVTVTSRQAGVEVLM